MKITFISCIICGALAFAAGAYWNAHRSVDCAVLPRQPIEMLSLEPEEIPTDYGPIYDQTFLTSMGMSTNPDYIGNLSQVESVAKRGGLVSFLAAYGPDGEPRMMINGILFRNGKHMEEFMVFQREKKRPVLVVRKTSPEGTWLLIAARDPKADYSEGEQSEIMQGLAHYQRRICAESIMDSMWQLTAANDN